MDCLICVIICCVVVSFWIVIRKFLFNINLGSDIEKGDWFTFLIGWLCGWINIYCIL